MASSVFLSHTHADHEIAQQIYHDLTNAGFRCWLDEAEIRPGDSVMASVEDTIDEMDFLAVLLSRASINSSWVRAELRMAMTEELSQAHVRVIGLVVDDCRVPGFLRDKLYIDLRIDFAEGVHRLIGFLHGEPHAVTKPRQAVLTELIEGADAELWQRYTRRAWDGRGSLIFSGP